jgi:cation transport ATPase
MVASVAAAGLLLPEPIDSGGVLTWARVPAPLLVAGAAFYRYRDARLRGEHASAHALLTIGTLAAVFMALIAGG